MTNHMQPLSSPIRPSRKRLQGAGMLGRPWLSLFFCRDLLPQDFTGQAHRRLSSVCLLSVAEIASIGRRAPLTGRNSAFFLARPLVGPECTAAYAYTVHAITYIMSTTASMDMYTHFPCLHNIYTVLSILAYHGTRFTPPIPTRFPSPVPNIITSTSFSRREGGR